MSNYYVLDTQTISNTCRSEAYTAHIATHDDEPYATQTTSWAAEQTRLTDSKYIVPVCTSYTNPHSYTIEASASNWFPSGADP